MKHEGHSGFGLHLENGIVTKWTVGSESSQILMASYDLQSQCGERIPGVKALDCFGAVSLENEFSFQMPHLDVESGFTTREHISEILKKCVLSRHIETRTGFNNAVLKELNKFDVPELKSLVVDKLRDETDIYPAGFCHGDLGFANMLVQDGQIYLIDFTPSFVQSPLVDIVTMEMSLPSYRTKKWHRDLVADLKTKTDSFKEHRDIIRMTKVLSFFRDSDSQQRRDDLLDLFHGRI